MREMCRPKVSCNTTVYNNIPWIKSSFLSVVDACRLLKNVYSIDCEIVAIDNYSSDGTYEEMLKIKHEMRDIPIRVSRYKYKRGLGRYLALLRSKGSHVVC